ncbi:MAG: right-handed parallel beta-helix repeat-containing protein, partial [Oscillospiraceae bacterium]|nr:right-handed parallel beta-helix repeat-containing protein [Oscillospiraceae bacterium]
MKNISKRLLSLAMVIAMVLSMMPTTVFETDAETTGEADLVISTVAELQAFADAVNAGNSYEGKLVVLANDINLNYTAVVIGTEANSFKGTFDGQNHTVSNLTIYEDGSESDYFADSDDCLGLFGVLNTPGVIKNVTVSNPYIVGSSYVGGIVGMAYTGKIENCHVTGEIDIEGFYMVGGITGHGYARITDCSVIGEEGWDYSFVGATYKEADLEGDNVGGIVGHSAEDNVISGCTVKNVTVSGTRKVGGIVGITAQNTDITDCKVEGVTVETTATEEYAAENTKTMSIGGIVGQYMADGNGVGGTLSGCTVSGLTFANENGVAVNAGALTGGVRASSGTTTAPAEGNITVSGNTAGAVEGENVAYLEPAAPTYAVMIGEQGYTTLADALAAAKTLTGDVTVEIYDKVTLNSSLSGSFDSIKFVGKEPDAEVYLDVQGYITATGKKVAFENLTLSKAQGGFITNAGFMNVAFGIYDVAEVAYTNCTFANGAYAAAGKVTYTGCTFQKSWEKYGLWAYGDVDVTVDGCTFDNDRGIKMYAEGAAKVTDLTVKNTDFSKLTGKPAIVLTYGESVALEGNTYSDTGVFELDLDGAPNGTAVTSDVAPVCKNDNGACGVLVDGKIYTTVAQAAAVATEGSKVTLLHDSAETVELAEGVILDKGSFTAAGVTVKTSYAATVNGVGYKTLEEAAAAATAGDTITLLSDVAENVTLPAGITLNGNDKKVGDITAAGEITFAGVTKANSFSVKYTNTTINIGEGACLEITGTGRMVIGHGCTFNITGTITDAKTADKATIQPSLIMPGASFTGAGVTFNVTNAYIKAPSSYCSSSKSASGTFDFNITNSIVETAGKLAFEAQSTAATVNFELKDSVLTTGSHLVFGVSEGEIVIDNSNVNVGTSRQIENRSTMTVKNGSVVNGAVATSSNAKNSGTLIVENATYAVSGEFSGSDLGTGTLIVKKGASFTAGSVTKANIVVDATGMAAGDEIAINANLSNLAGTVEVINNAGLKAEIVDGKIVLVEYTLSGTGTEADPYLINNLEDLLWFQAKVDEQAADGSTQFAGKYFKLTDDINLEGINWNPIGSMSGDHGSFKGVFDGNGHTISNLNCQQAGNGLGLFARTTGNAEIKNLTLNNVTVKSTNNSNYVGAVVGNAYASTKITNVHVTGNIDISGRGYIGGISGHGYVVMDNVSVVGEGTISSTFWCAGGILGYGGEGSTNIMNAKVEGTGETGLTITSAAGGLGAILGMAEDNGGTQPISGSNLSAKNVDIKTYTGAYGDAYSNYALGYLYGGNPTSNLTGELKVEDVEITTSNGVTPAVNDAVATVDGAVYFSLQAALDAAAAGTGNVTVEILRNVDLTNVDWNPVTVSAPGYPMVTVNGNGKTITGLNDMLFAGTWAGESGLIINDLTIEDSNIVNDKDDAKGTVGVGAFIGYPQASAIITLNNCHLVNSTVEGGHWTGGLIGMAGGYNGNDGPVFMNLTITGCSVTGSTITGKGSVGGVIGHGSCAAWTNVVIEDTTVSGNTITSTGSSAVKAGSVMGTIGAAGQPTTAAGETKQGGAFVSVTTSNNTVTSNGTTITTIYGRQGTETGMLEITGGTYDSYPIEKNVPYAAPKADYKIAENGDGTFGLQQCTYVAQVGETKYESLADALNAAVAGDTIVLLQDVTLDAVLTVERAITLNLNEKTLTGADGAVVLNIKAAATVKNGTIKGNKSGTSSGLIDIYSDLTLDGVTVETTKINALRFKAGDCTAVLTDCNITGAFKGYGGSVWEIQSGTYKASSTSINDQLNGTASISGGTFYYEIAEEECAPGYVVVDNGDGTYGVKYAPACFVDTNNNGVLDEGEAVYGNLDQVFAKHTEGDVYVVLTGNIVANDQVDTDADAHYYLSANVADGVTVDFLFGDDWNYIQKMSLGENITLNAPYLLAWTDLDIYGTVNTTYAYFTGAEVTVHEGAVLNANTGDATVQVKNGAKLTVNGTVNTAILNVWVGESNLTVSGANAKVNASWIDIWDGTPSVTVADGATVDVDTIKVSRGGTITVDAATLDADNLEIGHNGESIGTVTVTNNGTITNAVLTAIGSTITGPEGMNVTSGVEDYKVVYEDGVYKLAQIVYVAYIGEQGYETVDAAVKAAKDGDTIRLDSAEAAISMNATVDGGRTITFTGEALVDWSLGNLWIGRNGTGSGKVIFKDATITSLKKITVASTGIHVSGAKAGSTGTCDGVLEIVNSTIELDYLINRNEVIVSDNSHLTVTGGTYVHGRHAGESDSGTDEIATLTVKDSKLTIVNINGQGIGGESYGELILDNAQVDCQSAFIVNANGTVKMDADSTITAAKLTGDGNIQIDATDLAADKVVITAATADFAGNVTVIGNDKAEAKINANDIQVVIKVAEDVAKNNVTGVVYDDLQEALSAAAKGDTVILLTDATAVGLYVGSGKTLDLNGKTLTVKDYISAPFKGTHIVDSSNGKGLLVLAENADYAFNEHNRQLPLWTNEGVRFVSVSFQQALDFQDKNGAANENVGFYRFY